MAKEGRRLRRRVYGLILISICALVLAYFFWPSPENIQVSGGVTIVDMFYSSSPKFTDEALHFLSFEGIKVNTFKDSDITVEFYRKLPTYGGSLILLRVHAGILKKDPAQPTYLFTNEPYNTYDYWSEQWTKQVQSGKINPDDLSEKPVFTIGPLFITMSVKGSFNGSIIILSSCLGLYNNQLAKAFIQKGAKAFISWDEKVSLPHTDDACMLLIKYLIKEEMTISEAVDKVMMEVGPDPTYKSVLKYYPSESGSLRLNYAD